MDDELIHEGILSYRHLTSINEYPVLGFLSNVFPYKLLDILRIENTPLIYQNSVLESVETFAIESGNLDLISSSYHATSQVAISYQINQQGRTFSGVMYRDPPESARPEILNIFEQSQEDYEDDTLRFDIEHQEFFYSPIDVPFQIETESAEWTCISKTRDINNFQGSIYQYPELGYVVSKGIRDLFSPSKTSNQWIKGIAKHNPKCRGFLLYEYSFLSNANDFFPECPAGGVFRQAPSPYLRFVHIKNESSKPVKLEYLQLKRLQSHPYHLTDVTHRSRVLEIGEMINEEVNIMLQPGQDLLIPIEFGFDTKSHLKYTSGLEDLTSPEWRIDELQVLIAKPVRRETINFIRNSKDLSQQKINEEFLGSWKHIPKDFMNQVKSISELKASSPRRFAVGTFFDVKSVSFDGKCLDIHSPNDSSKVSISTYFDYGSCPYLMTFSKRGYWVEQGTILFGRQHESMKAEEHYSIDKEVLKVKIEERDQEITFLETVRLTYLNYSEGKKCTVECLASSLPRNGKGYYLLHQGESLELNISDLLPETASKIQLTVVGYYEILNSKEVV
ncbi:hypothetical protein PGN35_010125 [Nodosilinea sp. PGN35]|uniref:hypothetical protein n=1 Tax=Nodosilinea sp. PGN35 TaxID=3020489 RepID=UPI00398B03CC